MSEVLKPKRSHGERVQIWLYHYWKHRRPETREALKFFWYIAWGSLALYAFLYGLSYAIAFNLVQVPTVLSFGLVELFAFFLGRYFLHERADRRSVMELMAVVDNLPKYSHLIIHYVNTGLKEGYPRRPEYVLNTVWNWVFWVPPYLRDLARVGAVQRVEHDTEDEMYAFFVKNQTKVVRRAPQAYELSSGVRPTEP